MCFPRYMIGKFAVENSCDLLNLVPIFHLISDDVIKLVLFMKNLIFAN